MESFLWGATVGAGFLCLQKWSVCSARQASGVCKQKHGVRLWYEARRSEAYLSTFVVDSQNKMILHSLRILWLRGLCD